MSVITHFTLGFFVSLGRFQKFNSRFTTFEETESESVIFTCSLLTSPAQPNRIQSEPAEAQQKIQEVLQPIYQADPMSIENEKIDKNNALAMFKV